MALAYLWFYCVLSALGTAAVIWKVGRDDIPPSTGVKALSAIITTSLTGLLFWAVANVR